MASMSGDYSDSGSSSSNEFLPLTDALYGDPAFSALDLDLDSGDGELVPLLDLDLMTSDDAVLAYTDALVQESHCSDVGATLSGPYFAQLHADSPRQELTEPSPPPTPAPTTAMTTTTTQSRALAKKPRGSSNSSTKKSVKPNPNKARDERRGEVIYLRKKVAELEARLRGIQAKQIGNGPASASSGNSSGSLATTTSASASVCARTTHKPIVVNVWQDIASRQSDERVKAERENIRLRLVLENQLKIAKSLEKVLNKKATTKDIEEFVERNHMCPPTADASDEAVFNALLQDVEQSFVEIDDVWEANGLAHTETPLSNARVRSDAKTGMFLEVFANKILPFDMHATGSAVWRHFTYAKEHTPFRFYTYSLSKFLHSNEDTVVENFILKLDAKGTVANFRYKQILRRHVEADRIVIVWRAVIEAFEFSDEPISGVRFRERGYVVIKKPSQVAGDHTLLQTCYIFTPNFTEEVAGSDRQRVGAITDFVLASTAANVSSTHQMIENVLLEQALQSSGRVQSVF